MLDSLGVKLTLTEQTVHWSVVGEMSGWTVCLGILITGLWNTEILLGTWGDKL